MKFRPAPNTANWLPWALQSEYSWGLVCPFASKMTSKMDPKIIRIPTSVKSWFLQPLSRHMLVLRVPGTLESDLKSSKKVTLKQTSEKYLYF